MSKYLYGASVQGIQEFIFKTNTLKEIVGASELVKKISEKFLKLSGYKEGDPNIHVNAAGNIKATFDSYDACQNVVREFSKIIQQYAYGITISQAVVDMSDEKYKEQNAAFSRLEELLKVQRNRPSIALDMSIGILKHNATTAKPKSDKGSDLATQQKLEAYEKIEQDETFKELRKLSNAKNKIAIIHIDGNGLGEIIKNLKTPLSKFSTNLDTATKAAFALVKENKRVREIILGGDDVTVITNADDALAFTREFLEHFETKTQEHLGSKLTACAGIAFCNEKYPFHYGVALAEELCSQSKKAAKKINEKLAPSCLMFHNIQSSNYQSWKKFVDDELTIRNDKQTIKADFGPYYLSEKNQASIKVLRDVVESLRQKESPSTKLRSWMSELHKSKEYAQNFLERVASIAASNTKYSKKILDKNLKELHGELSLENLITSENKTPIYDVLQLLSVTENKQ